jgi:hypothetical protein
LTARALAALALLLARGGHGAPHRDRSDHASCLSALEVGRVLQQGDHFRQAETLLRDCLVPGCGPALNKHCRALHAQVLRGIPSVVPVVEDTGGQPLVDVEVTMDGQPLTSHPDGRSIPVDPGWHTFVFTGPDGASATEKVFIGEGQHNHPVPTSLPAAKPRR